MKYLRLMAVCAALLFLLTACGAPASEPQQPEDKPQASVPSANDTAVAIGLSDQAITVNGKTADVNETDGVWIGHDIVYYESGKDFTYGESETDDAHSAEQAAAHTVVHIVKAGTYRLSGKLSKGQIAIDLGKNADEDPDAVVTLVLDGIDLTCEVAPAIIFYRVYECDIAENASKDVDTAAAGANILLADGSTNAVRGSYVARIYKPDSVVLNEDGTAVEDAKKLHKYDGAVYSCMSMNVGGAGELTIYAENEGLDTERHLTINGGNVRIFSGNDGINTNEDGVSVTTINGGTLTITVTGETGEGDGIDSNGWLVINGGTVIASACAKSADAGIDSDMGIHLNGGTVIAGGSMLDQIEDGGQTYVVFHFSRQPNVEDGVQLKDADGKTVVECALPNAYSVLVISSPALKAGDYTLWNGSVQLAGTNGGNGNGEPPAGMTPPDGFGGDFGDRPEPPNGNFDRPGRPNGEFAPPHGDAPTGGERSPSFLLTDGANTFSNVAPIE